MLRAKISKGGKIAIPIVYRKKLQLEEGQEVFFEIQDNRLVVSSLYHTLDKARALVQQYCPLETDVIEEQTVIPQEEDHHD